MLLLGASGLVGIFLVLDCLLAHAMVFGTRVSGPVLALKTVGKSPQSFYFVQQKQGTGLSMAGITITDLCFSHTDAPLFSHVFLQLDTLWKLGLIGRNGRGKTTFLQLLRGKYPYSGSIASPVAFDYFPFHIADPRLTAYQLAGQYCPQVEPWALEREASLLELSASVLSRSLSTLSGGEVTKVLVCVLFLRNNSFLLIDEPTNHLDSSARLALGKYLNTKRGFILVSHDRRFLDTCIDHVLSINKATIEVQQGNFSSWQQNFYRQELYEQAENKKLVKEVSRLGKAAQRSAEWSEQTERGKFGNGPVDRGFIGHKAAKMMKKAKSVACRRQKAMDEKSALLKNTETDAPLSMLLTPFHASRLVESKNLSFAYAGRQILHNISCTIRGGERLVVQGGNGSGKSTFLKIITGDIGNVSGELHLPKGLHISYVPQDSSFVCGSLKDFSREHCIDESRLRAVLHRLGFEQKHFAVDMAEYSAGQKKKALLAKSLCQQAHLYIWDEPLNYIDLISRIQIEQMILAQQPTMIIVEHDTLFTERVGTAYLNLA